MQIESKELFGEALPEDLRLAAAAEWKDREFLEELLWRLHAILRRPALASVASEPPGAGTRRTRP